MAKITLNGLVDEDPGAVRASGLRSAESGADDEVHAALVALLAGFVAEERFDPARASQADLEAETPLVPVAAGSHSQPGLDLEHSRLAREHARAIVDAQWGAISALALEIAARGSVSRAFAELVIEDANGQEPARSALAAQRRAEGAREVA